MGHIAVFDWQTGTLHAELQVQETCRDITYVFFLFVLAAGISMFAVLAFCKIIRSSRLHRKNMLSSMIAME